MGLLMDAIVPSLKGSSIDSGGLISAASSAAAVAASIPFAARPYIYVGDLLSGASDHGLMHAWSIVNIFP
ncbi:hypothetical protein Tco_0329257 [Tanacetum coccineum]